MTQIPEIENFHSFLQSNLNNNDKLISYKCRYLTKPGDNYGSTMLSIKTYIQKKSNNNDNGNIEELELVAKLPPINPDFWDIFQPEHTFITESKFYTVLAPALIQLQKEANINDDEIIDLFPKCYGTRFNLLNNNEQIENNTVDKNAIIVLENLFTNGYKCGNRFKGFDYEHTLIILRDLAYFHALPIALRKLKPKFFNSQIKPFIRKFDLGKNMKQDLKNKLNEAITFSLKKCNISGDDLNYIMKLMKLDEERSQNVKQCPDGAYITTVHSDFWVNNMLILYDNIGKPDKIKIVDFQIAQYESLINDLIFFLFTSVESGVLEENCETLLKHYYKSFVMCQQKLRCDISECSFESFTDEIDKLAHLEIPHVIMMLRVLFMRRDAVQSFGEIGPNQFSDDDGMSPEYYQKVLDVINLLKKFGWFELKK